MCRIQSSYTEAPSSRTLRLSTWHERMAAYTKCHGVSPVIFTTCPEPSTSKAVTSVWSMITHSMRAAQETVTSHYAHPWDPSTRQRLSAFRWSRAPTGDQHNILKTSFGPDPQLRPSQGVASLHPYRRAYQSTGLHWHKPHWHKPHWHSVPKGKQKENPQAVPGVLKFYDFNTVKQKKISVLLLLLFFLCSCDERS
uniref:uncharacterized protein LOC120884415 isoform X2 n=1 Tax=Ictidomys tridecemlineatus TaxID=43179 RepID=UPI001A9EF8EE|nr:uncharacterized protein LOC120884415 isoform X2 [Ictidomys tridecemlineatus]